MPCWGRTVAERRKLQPIDRERPVRFTALIALLLSKGPLKQRRRKDEYLLLLWLSENASPQDALAEFVKGLLGEFDSARRRLVQWLDEELGLEAFRARWRERFGYEPSVEAFWLYLARDALCTAAEGCLVELCAKDALAFAQELLERAPGGSWLLWRRKKSKPQGLDACQKAIFDRVRVLWRDELSRKLIHEAGRRFDGVLAGKFLQVEPRRFPVWFLAAPLWYPYVERWLEQLQAEAGDCGGEAYVKTHSPPFPQLFDEFTAPFLPKRRGCRSQRPGLGFWAKASRSAFPQSFDAGVRVYGRWAGVATEYSEHKRLSMAWPDPWNMHMELINVYMEWFEELANTEGAP